MRRAIEVLPDRQSAPGRCLFGNLLVVQPVWQIYIPGLRSDRPPGIMILLSASGLRNSLERISEKIRRPDDDAPYRRGLRRASPNAARPNPINAVVAGSGALLTSDTATSRVPALSL